MKKIYITAIIISALGGGILSCKSGNPTDVISDSTSNILLHIIQPSDSNLIPNPYFQENDTFSLVHWIFAWTRPGENHFIADTPTTGRPCTLLLYPNAEAPGEQLNTIIPAPVGTHQYLFYLWAKGWGFASLGKSDSSINTYKYISFRDSLWLQYSFIDTITTNAGDSLRIVLNAGAELGPNRTGYYYAPGYFNSCQLVKLK